MTQVGARPFALDVAWDRGGDAALFEALEAAYCDLLDEVR
jgi:hypothetical protein